MSCEYHETPSIQQYLDSATNDQSYSFLHINARSLIKNQLNISSELQVLDHNIFIISITETWTNAENEDLVNIKDFTALINSRKGEKGWSGINSWKKYGNAATLSSQFKLALYIFK